MKGEGILAQLNVAGQCRKYNLSLWQCPSFLTLVMGILILIAMVGTYFIADRFSEEPEMAALIVTITTIILFVVGYLIVRSFSYLAEANQMKSEFVSITSHQLRTPLASLKWSLNLLMDEKMCQIGVKEREYLNIIQEGNERMIKLVNDLLDVSRIDQSRLDLKPQKFSLVNLVEDLRKELLPFAEQYQSSISVEKENNLADAWADSSRIRLVAQNLIDNAIKYSKEGGVVRVKIFKNGNYIKCEIKDSGLGIPQNQRSKIFQKFFRCDNAKKRQTSGTGLGLFIAKAIIELSKGEIGFESEEGKGSNFWFTIPVANKKLIKAD